MKTTSRTFQRRPSSRLLALTVLLPLIAAGCGGGGSGGGGGGGGQNPNPTPVITLNANQVTFNTLDPANAGSQLQLVVTDNSNGMDVTAQSTFTSSDPSTAAVNASGLVQGINNGAATITADFMGGQATLQVTVDVTPTAVTAAAVNQTIFSIGGSTQLTVTGMFTGVAAPLDITPANRGTTYASSNTSVAVVTNSGQVIGISNGMATITVDNRGVQDTIVITVDTGTAITAVPNPVTLQVGGTRQLTVTSNNASMTDLTSSNTGTAYGSSNSIVAGVGNDGLITALSAGTATITIINGALSTTVDVNVVQNAPSSVDIGNQSGAVGGTVSVPVNLTLAAGDMPTQVQVDFMFQSAALALPAANRITAGAAANAAGAGTTTTINGNMVSVVVQNAATPTVFAAGNLFNISFDILGTAPIGNSPVVITQVILQDAGANNILSATVDGSVDVQAMAAGSIAVGSATGQQGTSVTVPINLTVNAGAMPTFAQIDLSFNSAALSVPNVSRVTAGAAATAAGATVTTQIIGGNQLSIMVENTATPTVFGSGVLVNIQFDILGAAPLGVTQLSVTQGILRDAAGGNLAVNTINGSVNVQAAGGGAQQATLTIDNIPAAANTSVTVPIALSLSGGVMPTALQINFTFDAAVLSIPNNNRFTAGAAATAAGATVTGNVNGNQASVIVTNLGTPTVFAAGDVILVQFDVAAGAPLGSSALTVTQALASDAAGNAINTLGANGSVIVSAPTPSTITVDSNVNGQQGQITRVPVNLTLGVGQFPTAIQVNVSFTGADLAIPNNTRFVPGVSAMAAGATVSGNVNGNTATIIVANLANPTVFANGELFSIDFDVLAGATIGTSNITVTQTVFSDSGGNQIPSMGVDGSVDVVAAPANTTLTMGTATGQAGQMVTVPVSLAIAAGDMPTALQLDFTFDTTVLSLPNVNRIVAGTEANRAGATVFSSINGNAVTVIVTNIASPTVFNAGQLFTIQFDILAGAANGNSPLTVTNAVASDAAGNSLNAVGVNGSVNVQGAAGGQNVTLTIGNPSAAAGNSIDVPVTLSLAGGAMPTAVQINFTFDPAVLSIPNNNRFLPGPVATAAGATVSGNVNGNTATVIVTNLATPTVFGAGDVLLVRFDVAGGAAMGPSAITVTQALASDANGAAIPSNGVNGSVTVAAPTASTVTAGMVSAQQGQIIRVPFSLNLGISQFPTGIQVNFSFTGTDLAIPNNNRFIAGAAATAAGATVSGNVNGSTATVIVTNLANPTAIGNGVLFFVEFDVQGTAAIGNSAVVITQTVFSDSAGNQLPSMGVDGAVNVTAAPATTTLTIGSGSANAGQMVTVPINLNIAAGDMPTAVQIDFTFDAAVLDIPNNTRFMAGVEATRAGATVSANVNGNQATVIVTNIGSPTVFNSGELVLVQFDVNAAAPNVTTPLMVVNTVVSDAAGNAINSVGVDGSVVVGGGGGGLVSTLTIGTGTAQAGQMVTVPIDLSVQAGDMPTAIQIDFTFDTAVLDIPNNARFTAGAAATAAGATVTGSVNGNQASIIITNLTTPTVFGSGTVANVQFDVLAGAAAGVSNLSVTQTILSDAGGNAINSMGVDGSVTVQVVGVSTLTIGNGSGNPGQMVTVPIDLSVQGGDMPTAIQIDFTFDTAVLDIPNNTRFMAGAAATAAGATVTGNVNGNQASIIITNTGTPTVFASGTVANVQFDILAGAAAGVSNLSVTQTILSDAGGNAINSVGIDGSVNVMNVNLTSLTIGTGTAQTGQMVTIPIDLSVQGGDMPTALQIDFTFDTAVLDIPNNTRFTAGAAATAAGATVSGNVNGNQASIIITNTGTPTVFGNGTVANVQFDVLAGAAAGLTNLTVVQTVISDAGGNLINSQGVDGSVTVQAVAVSTLTIGTGAANPGQMVTVPIDLNVQAGDMPTALQIDFTFDTAVLDIPNNTRFTAGAAATAAGATVSGNVNGNQATVIVTNTGNPTVFMSGTVINVQFDILAGAAIGNTTLSVVQTILSDAGGNAIASAGIDGSVTVNNPNVSTLTIGNGSGLPGNTATVPIDLSVQGGDMPTAIQIDFTFDTAIVSIPNNTRFTAGAAATAAGATVSGNVNGNQATIIITNTGNPTVFGSGTVANVLFDINAGATPGASPLNVVQTILSDAGGNAIASAGINGSVVVQAPPAQTTLTINSGSGNAGGLATIPVDLSVAAGDMPTAIQIDFTIDPAALAIPDNTRFTAGAAATAAGATVSGNINGNQVTVIVTNLGTPTVFGSGTLFNVEFDVVPNAAVGMTNLTVVQTVVSDAGGNAIASMGMGGTFNVQAVNTSTLFIGKRAGAAGGMVTVPINLNVAAGDMPTGIQIDFTFDAAVLDIPNNTRFTAGAAATAAGATVSGNVNGNQASIIITNTGNPTVFTSGTVVNVQFDVQAAAPSGNSILTVTQTILVDAGANTIASQGNNGTVTIP